MGSAYLLFGAAPTYSWSLLAAALVGLGSAVWHPAAVATLSNRFPERRATVLAVHGTGATLSDTLTPLAAGALLVAYPWQDVLGFQIVPGLLLGVIVWNSLWAVLGGNET
jgi:MFS family permease